MPFSPLLRTALAFERTLKFLLPIFIAADRASRRTLTFESAQLGAPDFSGDCLGQFAEFDAPNALVRRDVFADMLKDRSGCLGVRREARCQHDKCLWDR